MIIFDMQLCTKKLKRRLTIEQKYYLLFYKFQEIFKK